MRRHTSKHELETRQKTALPAGNIREASDERTEELETASETDDTEPDECDLKDVDDGRWDAFILDDDGEPLPEYGDFWFPD